MCVCGYYLMRPPDGEWGAVGSVAWSARERSAYGRTDRSVGAAPGLHPPSVAPAPRTSLRAFHRARSACRVNVAVWLHRECGKPFQPFCRFPIVCGPRNIRRPDIAVDGGPSDPSDWLLERPLLTVDVLPPGIAEAALAHRLRDYAAALTIRHCLMVELDCPRALVYGRGTAAPVEIRGLESAVAMPGLDLPPLPMAVVYDGLHRA